MLRVQGFANLRIWPRGVDTTLFRPEHRSQELRQSWLKERGERGDKGDIGGSEPSENKTILLYVGRVSWEKNLRLLVQAYRHMDHSHCHLVIVGDGPAYAEMQQELAGVPVTFTGYLSDEALATAYASADIFAFPSRTETFGQVVLEAMASGLPVVGLLAEGVCDLVEHNRAGLLLNTSSLDEEEEQIVAYRHLLTQLIEEPHTRSLMGQAALVEAQKFSWYEAMECLMRGYQEVIEHAHTMVAA